MARWCLRGTRQVYATLGLGAKPLNPPERFLRQLPAAFTTAEARADAEDAGVPRRTMFRGLDELQESGALEKLGRGRYLVEVHYRPAGAAGWTSLADMLLAMGYAEPYPSPA